MFIWVCDTPKKSDGGDEKEKGTQNKRFQGLGSFH